jgi:hypothetical protein
VACCIPPGVVARGKACVVAAIRSVVEAADTDVARGKARVVAAPLGVVEAAATAVTSGEACVVTALCGVVEAAVTAVARGETRVVDSGNFLFDLAVRNLRCAARRLCFHLCYCCYSLFFLSSFHMCLVSGSQFVQH